jgi:hypothetical protein
MYYFLKEFTLVYKICQMLVKDLLVADFIIHFQVEDKYIWRLS